ncbi:MAG TPA: formate transporter FocA [Coriobacteriia bacterium]|nr:formate transporter FocA [Coriobacteriia bacterium]
MDPKDIAAIKPDCLAPVEIELKAETVGLAKAGMGFRQNAFLSIAAGMFIGMGGMFMLLIKADPAIPWIASQLLGGLVFCLGLFLVVVAGAELFTGNTLMAAGALSKKFSWCKVFKNWVIVWVFNFIGALILVCILYCAQFWAIGPTTDAVGLTMVNVGVAKINQDWLVLMLKGIMCNFLVCLAVWIAYAGRTVIDKFVGILLPISAFVACGFEHCVANMFFLPMAFVMKISGAIDTSSVAAEKLANLDITGIFYNLSAATVGNIIGGAVLVACLYWFAFHKKQAA